MRTFGASPNEKVDNEQGQGYQRDSPLLRHPDDVKSQHGCVLLLKKKRILNELEEADF